MAKLGNMGSFNPVRMISSLYHHLKGEVYQDPKNYAPTGGRSHGFRAAPLLARDYFGTNKFKPGNHSQFTAAQLRALKS